MQDGSGWRMSRNCPRFGFVAHSVLTDPKLSPTAKGVYALLASYAGSDPACYPSQERLAVDMGLSTRSIRNALHELGQVIEVQRGGGSGKAGNVYLFFDGIERGKKGGE